MSKQEIGNKLNGRDFINIEIYAAIYFAIVMALAMTGLIPIFLILLSSMVGIVAGIPFMLFLTKVKKPGMILIMNLIIGILMFFTESVLDEVLISQLKENEDEPTSGLDYLQMNAVGQILNQLKEEGRTIITVTHDSEFIEYCCDNVIHTEEV